jgi:ubiquinone/menaquinone biosynthesis C-methylase UbiE
MEMISFLACPRCRGDLVPGGPSFACPKCRLEYPVTDGIAQFDLPKSFERTGDSREGRSTRQTYWDHGWEARHRADHATLAGLKTKEDWVAYVQQECARAHGHVSQVEAGKKAVEGKVVLDIGCGGGNSSAIFGYFGANYIGVDHSPNAAMYALRHLKAVGGEGFTAQGNAENLPIRDASIDVVYSNGVLHHTPNFWTAMDEAYRVLKPGGKAVIALYATYSTQFGALRVIGALKGHFSRQARERWMGEATEGAWRTGNQLNPWTETFSTAQLSEFARKHEVQKLSFRKSGNPIGEIPRLGVVLMRSKVIRLLDRALEPLLGSMLIMSYEK